MIASIRRTWRRAVSGDAAQKADGINHPCHPAFELIPALDAIVQVGHKLKSTRGLATPRLGRLNGRSGPQESETAVGVGKINATPYAELRTASCSHRWERRHRLS